MPPERDDPDIPEPDELEEPEEPDIPEPDELEEPEEPDIPEPCEPLRPLWPLIPERFVSPASSSEADGARWLLDALRELPSPMDWSSSMSRCDEEPDWPLRPDEPDCWSPCDPDRPDDPLMPPWFPPWFTFDEPEFLSRSVIWRTSFS